MRIRYSFMSRIVVTALTSQALANSTFAQDHSANEPVIQTHSQEHMNYSNSHWDNYANANQGHWAKAAADSMNSAYSHYQKIENGVIQNPMMALEYLVKIANHNKKHLSAMPHGVQESSHSKPSLGIDARLYALNVRYSHDMPFGQVSSVELSEGLQGKVLFTIVAHEKAKTNPFVLLESMVHLNDFYPLEAISGSKVTLKDNYNLHHHGFNAYHTAYYSLAKTLGINGMSFELEKPTAVEAAELRANSAAGSILSQRKVAEIHTNLFQAV